MPWTKSPPELDAAFIAALPEDPLVQRRKMFGYPAAFVSGNMFAGVHETNVVLRLTGEARQALPGAAPFAPMGRTMREYVVVPASVRDSGDDLRRWLAVAFESALALPPKLPRPRGGGRAGSR